MNREIKFRLWDKHRKIMFYEGDQLPESDELYCDDWTMFCSRLKILQNDYILMQYTGLKDKNGREIYEGDFIKFWLAYATTQTHYSGNIPGGSYTEPDEPVFEQVTGEVFWDEDRAKWSFAFVGKPPYDYDGNPYVGIEEVMPIIDRMPLYVGEVALLFNIPPYMEMDEKIENPTFLEILKEKGLNSVAEFKKELNEMEVIGDIFSNPVKEGI